MNLSPASFTTIFAIAILMLGPANPSSGQTACEGVRLTISEAGPFESFGRAVAVSGDTTFVAAPWDNELGTEAGAVYVYDFDPHGAPGSGWVETQKLLASDEQCGDEFGFSVAVDGDVALIGALHVHNDGAEVAYGAAYVFRFDGATWVEEQELLASDSAFQDGFGATVSISGDVAVIGACGHDHKGMDSGAAYVFRFDGSTWVEEQELLPSDTTAAFGCSVAISGNATVIGAMGDDAACRDEPACESGAAYVFRYDAETSRWVEQQKLIASDAAALDRFGAAVSIGGDVALIGARLDDDNGFSSGSAYVFRFDPDTSAWVEEQKLLASDGAATNQFGRAVAIDGDTAVIGAWSWASFPGGPSIGQAYVFRYNGSRWVQQQQLSPEPNPWTNFFGWSVAIDGDTTVIGAHGEDHQAGAAYLFDLATCPCPADLNGDGSVGILDLLALLAAWGTNPGGPPDFDGDGMVGILDLLTLLANWGPCP